MNTSVKAFFIKRQTVKVQRFCRQENHAGC